MAFNATQLREFITDVLKDVDLYSEGAVELLMLTAAVESGLGTYLKQIKGPAVGIFQMEPTTARYLWDTQVIAKKAKLSNFISLKYRTFQGDLMHDLKNNLGLQVIMARLRYYVVDEELPKAEFPSKLAAYWKKYYNTVKGKGTVEKALKAYEQYA